MFRKKPERTSVKSGCAAKGWIGENGFDHFVKRRWPRLSSGRAASIRSGDSGGYGRKTIHSGKKSNIRDIFFA
jgi:hypothetical protein